MAYNNINWQNNDTPLNADNMNNIMEGISLALGYTDRFKIPDGGITKPTMFRLGIANYSIVGNDVENNKTYGNYATALGTNTVAGSNAFEITNIVNKVITLTSGVKDIKKVLDSETTIPYSCQLMENYDLCGNITDVDETNNTITVDIIPNSTTTTGILWIPSHPELGDGKTIIGTGALAIGNNNKASQIGSFVAGQENIAGGKYSGVFGRGNIAGYCSAVFGQLNTANQWSFVSGYHNITKSPNTFTAGYGNIINTPYSGAIGHQLVTSRDNQFIVGCHNVEDTDAVFIVANGVAYTGNGSNALVVKSNGNTSIQGNANIGGAMISNVVQGATYKNGNGSVIINKVSTNNGYLGATGEYSFAAGNDITASGAKSFAFGTRAESTNSHSIAIGFESKATQSGSVAIGWGTKAPYTYSTALGVHTETAASKQLVCGTWNTLDANALFIIGNGVKNPDSEPVRSSAFVVKNNGQALLGNADILDDEKAVATKKYVDDKQEIGEWTPQIKSTIDWITIDSYNATYVKNGAQIELQFSVTLSWEEAGTSNVSLKFIGLPIVAGESLNYFLNANATFKDNITGLSYSNFNILGSGLNEFAFLCKEYQDYSQYTTQTVGTTVLKDYFGSSGNIQISGSATYTLFDF